MCMLKRCMSPRAKTTTEEEQAAAVHSVEAMSEQRASNIYHRVEFLRKIREKLTPTPSSISALKERLRAKCEPDPELPEWWVCGRHDAELIVIAKRYGLAHLDYAMMCDTTVSYLNTLKEHLKNAALLNKSGRNNQATSNKPSRKENPSSEAKEQKSENATLDEGKENSKSSSSSSSSNSCGSGSNRNNSSSEPTESEEPKDVKESPQKNSTDAESNNSGTPDKLGDKEADESADTGDIKKETDQSDDVSEAKTNGEEQTASAGDAVKSSSSTAAAAAAATTSQRDESPKSDSTEPLDETVSETFSCFFFTRSLMDFSKNVESHMVFTKNRKSRTRDAALLHISLSQNICSKRPVSDV